MPESSGDQWVYVAAPLFFYCVIVLGLAMWGYVNSEIEDRNPLTAFFRSISYSLNRLTGLPGWCMAGALTALMSAGIAAFGLYWDVAWHIDFGRDKELFTPSHTLILIGLNGLIFAAIIAVIFATLDRTDRSGSGVRALRIPWSALVLCALGFGSAAAFPLDDLWHQNYGVDVTLWSPTHLQLIAGGALSPLAIWLMIREGRREVGAAPNALGKGIEALTFGAILTGLATYQGEFDFGVPQFQVLYHPLLIAISGGLALVAARAALGTGGALLAVLSFVALRLVLGGLVGGALNHSFPRFPLYLAAAVAVEAVAWLLGTEQRVRFALVSGALVGTVGVAAEMAWVALSGWGSVRTDGLAVAFVLSLVAATAAALLGVALVQGAVPSKEPKVQPMLLACAGLALVAVLAAPLPRNVGDVTALITLDRLEGEATVTVQLEPAGAAEAASQFGVIAWQGGGRVASEFDEVSPGRYVSAEPIPINGQWKSMVALQRGDEVMAAPIYLPADPEIGASAIPAQLERREAFTRNTDILLREAKDGPAWPALLSYVGVAIVVAIWLSMFARASARVRPLASKPLAGSRFGGAEPEPA